MGEDAQIANVFSVLLKLEYNVLVAHGACGALSVFLSLFALAFFELANGLTNEKALK